MAFRNAAEVLKVESETRALIRGKLLEFGISFLDDSLFGIRPDDLILVGAPSGVGKTQFCVNVALANVSKGKRVHFFALEASEFEIERRLKYQFVANRVFSRTMGLKLVRPLHYDEWAAGEDLGLSHIDQEADEACEPLLRNLFTFYKEAEQFDVAKLMEQVSLIQDETDLVIVDHVHYFDWDDQNDNRAIKEIARTARDLCLRVEKPMILVAHLRKRDRQNAELCAGLDEFHGSSDLTKIATKVITLAPGGPCDKGGYYTFFRTPKNRHSSSSSRFLAQMVYDEKRGKYEQEYKLGWANQPKFGELDSAKYPRWHNRTAQRKSRSQGEGVESSPGDSGLPRQPERTEIERRVRNYAPGARND